MKSLTERDLLHSYVALLQWAGTDSDYGLLKKQEPRQRGFSEPIWESGGAGLRVAACA